MKSILEAIIDDLNKITAIEKKNSGARASVRTGGNQVVDHQIQANCESVSDLLSKLSENTSYDGALFFNFPKAVNEFSIQLIPSINAISVWTQANQRRGLIKNKRITLLFERYKAVKAILLIVPSIL